MCVLHLFPSISRLFTSPRPFSWCLLSPAHLVLKIIERLPTLSLDSQIQVLCFFLYSIQIMQIFCLILLFSRKRGHWCRINIDLSYYCAILAPCKIFFSQCNQTPYFQWTSKASDPKPLYGSRESLVTLHHIPLKFSVGDDNQRTDILVWHAQECLVLWS